MAIHAFGVLQSAIVARTDDVLYYYTVLLFAWHAQGTAQLRANEGYSTTVFGFPVKISSNRAL
jgi:hypothetical protein